jgi:UMF1 family MFS transporter
MFQKGNKKLITAWTFYDWANSVYNLVITATIFPIYYKAVTETKLDDGTVLNSVSVFGMQLKNTTLYDLALAFAYLLIVILAPILSGIADYGGNKKRFMQFFCYMGAVSCSLMFFFDSSNILMGIMLAIFACMGWAGSLVFYNAYLPEIAEPKDHDKVSARGFAMGYFGSALLLIANLVLIMGKETGEEKLTMMRYAFLGVGIWWIAFAQIPFYFLPGKTHNKKASGNALTKGYQELNKVWKELRKHKLLPKFLLAFFIYSMGVQTVMLVANHFGAEEIKMEAGELITTILIIQFVALAGSFLFSYLSSKKGNIFTLKVATFIWALICLVTFLFVYTAVHFMIVAAFVGLVMGGIQSLSRSTYSKMLPETEDHASFFSFYDVTEKLSIVFGMATFGIINEFSPSMREPIVALISFFAIGFLLLIRIPKENTN